MMDRWDVLLLVGVGMLGAGVRLQFGTPWALMLLGVLALAVTAYHEARAGRRQGR